MQDPRIPERSGILSRTPTHKQRKQTIQAKPHLMTLQVLTAPSHTNLLYDTWHFLFKNLPNHQKKGRIEISTSTPQLSALLFYSSNIKETEDIFPISRIEKKIHSIFPRRWILFNPNQPLLQHDGLSIKAIIQAWHISKLCNHHIKRRNM